MTSPSVPPPRVSVDRIATEWTASALTGWLVLGALALLTVTVALLIDGPPQLRRGISALIVMICVLVVAWLLPVLTLVRAAPRRRHRGKPPAARH
ncbi:MAG: hypothetical protein M3068_02270 [Gemmatimonadota bacterium]|nr:hypothetical protein [Gemmatimonadota bacterium]